MSSFLGTIKKTLLPHTSYERLVCVNLSRGNLLHNLDLFQKSYPSIPVCPVLKANAYGHGLREVASILSEVAARKANIPFFVVDSYHEALVVKKILPSTQDILIIGYTPLPTLKKARAHNFIFTLTSIEQIHQAAQAQDSWNAPKRFHVKIDTGMHRQGILPEEAVEAITLFKRSTNMRIEGVCSHLAEADSSRARFTDEQIEIWNRTVGAFEKEWPGLHYHLTNTAGADHAKKARVTATRLGIGLYGIVAPTHTLYGKVRPVLEMTTLVTGIKKLKKGEFVGYDRTFMAPKDMLIATLPVGYFEAFDRRLSNKGSVTVATADGDAAALVCPIIGRVSMDITTIEVNEHVRMEAEVIAISRDRGAANSIESLAKIAETIPYELLVHIPEGLHREIVD